MQIIHRTNVRVWSCFHQTHLRANLSYAVTQERGYWVSRLISMELLESPVRTALERRADKRPPAKVIPFHVPRLSNRAEYQERPMARFSTRTHSLQPDPSHRHSQTEPETIQTRELENRQRILMELS
jgi:hypothetical protein